MNMKSLLLGSAVAMVAATGAAQAADTVVMAAAPEPVEYVRVCDVYGAGFYYIPGSDTCLKIGGQLRYEILAPNIENATGYSKHARYMPTVDARTETSWGTVRAYGEVYIDYNWPVAGTVVNVTNAAGAVIGTATLPGSNFSTLLNQGFIQLIQNSGTWTLGKVDSPYDRFLGYGAGGMFAGNYYVGNTVELSYQFNSASGFSGIIALTDGYDATSNWMPDVEGGVKFKQGWGDVGAVAGYDESMSTWGAKAIAHFNVTSSVTAALHVYYSSGAGAYAITAPAPLGGGVATWAVMGVVQAQLSKSVAAVGHVQWLDLAGPNLWEVRGGLKINPGGSSALEFRPEVRYRTRGGAHTIDVGLRVDRNF